ncbi:MAG: 3-phosphoserine/phosphohydroxythreonine transaminase [Ruminococcaceae bacterium]|nr:3-phosphoserine/phosphohydroxythreonine transaminase [Oscillospiraceae bacterium]
MLENRVYNFSAGPSMLPESVLVQVRDEMLNYQGSGMSILEMSHRSKVYDAVIVEAENQLRKTMNIPDNYKVLFLQGGATLQFAAVAMNLMTKNGKADYIVTGSFSKKAAKEAKKYGEVNIAASTESENFTRIPRQEELNLSPDADYVHICFNNTIYGTHWDYIPETGNVPLVADMSSCILSEEVDVSKFGLIYAGAQKNMAPAGLTIVIVREDLIGNAMPTTPIVMDYAEQANAASMYNTPPTFTIYVAKLVCEWIASIGGVAELNKVNVRKAAKLYAYLDESKLFQNPVSKESRSLMNVTFKTGDEELDAKFVKEAAAEGLLTLKGHRAVGGMRASIYNAVPEEGVDKLIAFMKEFEAANA